MKTKEIPEKNELNILSGRTFFLFWLMLFLLNIVLSFIYQFERTPLHFRIVLGLFSFFFIGLAVLQRLQAIEKPLYYFWFLFIPIFNLLFIIWLSLPEESRVKKTQV